MDHLIPDSDPLESAQHLLGADAQVKRPLGSGKDGIVFSTTKRSVIKIFWTVGRFDSELGVYQRLAEHEVRLVAGHKVPSLITYDRELLAIEMTHVSPPYVIDFAQSALDVPETFGDEAVTMWNESLKANFGERYSAAMAVYNTLVRRYGVYHYDLSVNNLRFADDEGE